MQDVAEAIARAGAQVWPHLGDLAEVLDAHACAQLALRSFGALDVMVSNAGNFIANAETDVYRIEDFGRAIRNNVRTAFLMTKIALPHLQASRGNIVFTGSEAGLNSSPNFTPYGASKGLLHAFMKGVALEQAPYCVRANCVCPGPIDTAWTRGEASPIPLATQAGIGAMVPLGRRGTPEEIANAIAFLTSDEASYVTGALWLAGGGVTQSKGDIGAHTPADLQRAPDGVLTLKHSHDGLRGKEIYRAAE